MASAKTVFAVTGRALPIILVSLKFTCCCDCTTTRNRVQFRQIDSEAGKDAEKTLAEALAGGERGFSQTEVSRTQPVLVVARQGQLEMLAVSLDAKVGSSC